MRMEDGWATDGRIGQKEQDANCLGSLAQNNKSERKIVRGELSNWVALTIWILVSGDRSEHKTLIRCSRKSRGFASAERFASTRGLFSLREKMISTREHDIINDKTCVHCALHRSCIIMFDKEVDSSPSPPHVQADCLDSAGLEEATSETTPLVLTQNEPNNVQEDEHDSSSLKLVPILNWSLSFTSHVFLALSCLAALLQDANEVVIPLTLLQPFFWLAFGLHTQTTRRALARWVLVIAVRAIPAMEYFYYDTTRIVAFATAFTVIFIVYAMVGAAVWVQIKWWKRRYLASCPVLAILLTAVFQLLFRFSPIGGAGNIAMGMSRVVGLRQVASLGGRNLSCILPGVDGKCSDSNASPSSR